MRRKILLASDKFKGSLSANEVCHILMNEIVRSLPDSSVEICPLADGGEGSLGILASYLNLERRECLTFDPLNRTIKASYYTNKKTAYIELASTSGLSLLDQSEQNPMRTSTYGTGCQIRHALNNGAERIYLFLGGSATNDGGMGIVSALGYMFFDKDGNVLSPQGSSLRLVNKIIPPETPSSIKDLVLCCDVENRPFGLDGAAHVYAQQKGAKKEDIIELDLGLKNLCEQIGKYNGVDLSQLVGGGAAGGVALCLSGLMDGQITSGFNLISKTSNLESKIANSDLVISGEGSLDDQSLKGKVVSGVADLCKKYEKKLWLVVGKNDLKLEEENRIYAEKIFSIVDIAMDKEDAILNGAKYMKEIGQSISNELNDRN